MYTNVEYLCIKCLNVKYDIKILNKVFSRKDSWTDSEPPMRFLKQRGFLILIFFKLKYGLRFPWTEIKSGSR